MQDNTPEFALLWGRSQSKVAAYIRAGVVNEHDAEDLFQESVVIAAKQFKNYDRKKPFTPWVLGISHNLILNYYRNHKRRHAALTDEALCLVAHAITDQPNNEEERLVALRGCMSMLNENEQSLLNKRYKDGQRVQSIASELGTTPNKVSVALFRIRKGLLACIENKLQRRAAL